MLTSLVHEPIDSDLSTEDVFSSALHLISPDSTSTLHGNPGCSITYSSRRFGDIELRLAEPQTEEERKLFGQYLWNAEVLLTELIDGSNSAKTAKEGTNWDVKDERILEFGAGEWGHGAMVKRFSTMLM